MRLAFADGIAWGDAKQQLFELINGQLQEPREKYVELLENPSRVESILQDGGEKARQHSQA